MATSYYIMKMCRNNSLSDYYRNFKPDTKVNIHSNEADKICRVCLKSGNIPLFQKNATNQNVTALRTFTDINIDENDEYPKYLCKICFNFLKEIIAFQKIAKQSDEIFKHIPKQEYHDLDDTNFLSDSDLKDPSLKWTNPENDDMKFENTDKIKSPVKITCNVCNKVINRSYYKEHVTMHDPNHQKYVCDICGKSFRLRCAYHNHSLRHRTDFPYKCKICPYRGRYAELLKTHMRTHSGDYRYMCTECPARFLFKSNLNSHMLKHKEPQFKCDSCKRSFHTKLMLQRHFEADHLGIKNHVCNLCGKAFGYRNAMMKHQRHVHKREKYMFGRMPSYLAAERKEQGSMN